MDGHGCVLNMHAVGLVDSFITSCGGSRGVVSHTAVWPSGSMPVIIFLAAQSMLKRRSSKAVAIN